MRPDGTYNDDHCLKIFPYICKMPLAAVKWNSECHTPYADYKRDNDASRCYKFHLKPQSWMKAVEACDAEQGYLAIINTQDEADFLVNMTKNAAKDAVEGSFLRGFVHVGFNWFEDDWKTIGGETIQEAGYSTWGERQPDGGNEELCGAMAYDGKLHDVGCQQPMCFFICELEVKAFSFLSEKFDGA
ncbi:PREDICTED: hemolymph lipopolysaccharide-binding protein-like [Papilio polytes]|uniref:hemolymph lipopolysaccharide-binding protein-like n=1 Tax=Papilio polytes TaxID=76194 RepID=UPI0006760F65|nr:PREDICTED: hemolymph lipopolysaccharide-binding protein-like [Papilio polytes]